MSSMARNAQREQAKKLYKQEVKKVPKAQRVPFHVFFENYKQYVKAQKELTPTQTEDFNFDETIVVNENTDKE